MLQTGLVSVTYRALKPHAVLALAQAAGLSRIEWGGDIHVPHGDFVAAENVGAITRAAGLSVVSYGTYYRAGTNGSAYRETFQTVLDTAAALGAPSLRLWTGSKNSEEVSASERSALTAELQVCADMAAICEKRIAFEYHSGTLTNTAASAVQLIQEIDRENVDLYWQPNQYLSFTENLQALNTVLPYVSNVHVFAWTCAARHLLAEHADFWKAYIGAIAADHHRPSSLRSLLLEFVPGNDPDLLISEAETLHRILSEVQRST